MGSISDAALSIDDIVRKLQRRILVESKDIDLRRTAVGRTSEYPENKGSWFLHVEKQAAPETKTAPFFAYFLENESGDITGAFSGQCEPRNPYPVLKTADEYYHNFLYPSVLNFAYDQASRVIRHSGSLFLFCLGIIGSVAAQSPVPGIMGAGVGLAVFVGPRSYLENYKYEAKKHIVDSLGPKARNYKFGEDAKDEVYEHLRKRTVADT